MEQDFVWNDDYLLNDYGWHIQGGHLVDKMYVFDGTNKSLSRMFQCEEDSTFVLSFYAVYCDPINDDKCEFIADENVSVSVYPKRYDTIKLVQGNETNNMVVDLENKDITEVIRITNITAECFSNPTPRPTAEPAIECDAIDIRLELINTELDSIYNGILNAHLIKDKSIDILTWSTAFSIDDARSINISIHLNAMNNIWELMIGDYVLISQSNTMLKLMNQWKPLNLKNTNSLINSYLQCNFITKVK